MRIAINGNRHQEGHFSEIDSLISTLVRRGDDVVLAEPFFNYLADNLGPRFALGLDTCPLTRQPSADLAVSIGGDGAFLKTARWIGDAEIPVAGINTGHLGYLSAFTFEDAADIDNTLLQGRFRTENRSLLVIETDVNGVRRHFTALNEAAFTRGDTGAMLNVAVTIDGRPSINFLGDGLIVSSPTGSTAYNLSVGGPILDPALEGWVISPVAAHSLSMRPLVVKDSSTLEIRITTRGTSYRMSTDGKSVTLPVDAVIRITRAPYCVKLVLQP
ncbi:MAG: NAD(+)/NADH kinase, partial [Muribaculaceae bacterium]|nr:NAD(+)/NADH kinase [Muribaculaceae bacterium]